VLRGGGGWRGEGREARKCLLGGNLTPTPNLA